MLLARREDAGAARATCCSPSTTCTCATTAGSRRCAASRSRCGPARSSGIAGVDGNGQTELIDAITGLLKSESGTIRVAGSELRNANARDMLDAGVGHIPEDRQRRGLVLEFSIAENIALHDYAKPARLQLGLALPRTARRRRAPA